MIELDEIPDAWIAPDPSYDCDTCRDTGFERIEVAGESRVRRCGCRDPASNQKLVRAAMAAAGMQVEEIESAYTPWDEGHQAKPAFAREWLAEVMSGRPKKNRNPWCLGLLGLPGRGKTKAAAVLVRVFIESGGRAPLWVRVPEGFDAVQMERRSDAYTRADSLEKRIEAAGLLVLDDFGIAHRADPELIEATTCEWLARRHRRHAPSIFTTNAAALRDIGAPRLESRISEGLCQVMEARSDFRDSMR